MTVQRVELPTDPAARREKLAQLKAQADIEQEAQGHRSMATVAEVRVLLAQLDAEDREQRDLENRRIEAKIATDQLIADYKRVIADLEKEKAQLARDRQRREEAQEVRRQQAELDKKREKQMFDLRMRAASAMYRVDVSEEEAQVWYEKQRTARGGRR